MPSSPTDLLKPRNIQVEDLGNNTSKITLEPLERGFGLDAILIPQIL